MPALWEMPTVQYGVKRLRNGRRTPGVETELNTARIAAIFESLREYDTFVTLEKAQVRPATGGQGQGVVSQAKFFGQFTEIRGILTALKIPFECVHAATWKAAMFRGQTHADDDGKEASRLKAIQLYPMLSERLALKKSHGLAEALLIADYGQRRHYAPF